MRPTSIRGARARHAKAAVALLAGLGLWSCGGAPSLTERMTGTYATASVQADLADHEKDFVSDDLVGRFDALDKAEATQGGAVWARLRLEGDGRFTYEGPASDPEAAGARLGGRWTARAGFVDLAVERAEGTGAADLPKSIACPASVRWVDLPFLTDPAGHGPVRLARR